MKEKVIVEGFTDNLDARNRRGVLWHIFFQASTIFGIIALVALMLNIINGAFGYVAYEAKVDPDTLAVNGTAVRTKTRNNWWLFLNLRFRAARSINLKRISLLRPDPVRKYINWSSTELSGRRLSGFGTYGPPLPRQLKFARRL